MLRALPYRRRERSTTDELGHLATGDAYPRTREYGYLSRLESQRAKRSEEEPMLYLAGAVAGFLFVYLFTALIRPEWF